MHRGSTGDSNDKPKGKGHAAGFVHVPELILYERIDFGGASWRTNLGHCTIGEAWDYGIGSLIVVSGTWMFYERPDFEGSGIPLEPGYYRCVRDTGLPNNRIASFKPIAF